MAGSRTPPPRSGAVARRHGVPYLLDACQAVGQTPIDVEALGCDFLSATGRKFLRGPRGTGFLYVRGAWLDRLEPAMIDHFAAPWVARDAYCAAPGRAPLRDLGARLALRLGLGAAVAYALEIGLEPIEWRVRGLAERLRAGLAVVPGAKVHDLGAERSAIVSFSVDGLDPRATVAALAAQEIRINAFSPDEHAARR